MTAFSFAYNPFVVLPVSLRATTREVEEAFQRRLAARPQDEAALTRARRLLLEPDGRLVWEMAWLVDVGPRDAVSLLGAMAGGDQKALLDALGGQPPLSKANVAADACGRLKSMAFMRPLLDAHKVLSAGVLTGLINEIHAAIPMAQVSVRQVDAALLAITGLHAGAALEAISAQADPAAAMASIAEGPDAAAASGFVEALKSQFARRYPAPTEAAEVALEPTAAPIHAGALADVHSGDHGVHWGEGAAGAAAAASAFMDAQLIFSAHDRFDTWGSARRVRRVLYVMGGALAAAVLMILVFAKGPPDRDDANVVDPPVNYVTGTPPPLPTAGGHHKPECIHVSGATYCTNG